MNATSKPQYPPNPKALQRPPKPPAATSGVLKITSDVKDSLVKEVEIIPPTKRCVMCRELKPLTQYHTNRAHADSLENRCKQCSKKYKADLKARKDAGEIVRRRGGVKRSITSPPVPPPTVEEVMPVGAKVTIGNNVTLQRIDVEARGAAIQQAVATAEIIAAVSLLLGMDRVQRDAVISMVQAFHITMEK